MKGDVELMGLLLSRNTSLHNQAEGRERERERETLIKSEKAGSCRKTHMLASTCNSEPQSGPTHVTVDSTRTALEGSGSLKNWLHSLLLPCSLGLLKSDKARP